MAVLKPEKSDTAPERRTSRRRPLTEIPAVTGVTVQSQTVQVIDAASGGLLIQSPLRLSPGTRARVEVGRSDCPLTVGGRVVRSEVVGFPAAGSSTAGRSHSMVVWISSTRIRSATIRWHRWRVISPTLLCSSTPIRWN